MHLINTNHKEKIQMTWQDLERNVRLIASCLWDRPATSETIAGVKCDCVLKVERDKWVFVEVSKESNLDKLRTDIAKFGTLRMSLFSQNIYSECYFVTSGKVTDSVRASGNDCYVKVCTVKEFESLFFNYASYVYLRGQKAFGSLIDISTGKPEKSTYIPVTYYSEKEHTKVNLQEIVKKLESGKKVILLGGFGTGKSCCTKQIFEILAPEYDKKFQYTLSVNLREHWGAVYGEEIIDRHLKSLGIDPIQFRKVAFGSNVIYLLDGFDEMGGQSWSSDNIKMQDIRKKTVIAIKDLLSKIQGGCLITGREHFFNSSSEMLNCFGLSDNDVEIIKCNDEFTIDEITQYLNQKFHLQYPIGNGIFEWLPRRPLIIQLVANELGELFDNDGLTLTNEYDVWNMFLDNLCTRESKISSYLDSSIIKDVMIEVGHCTRLKDGILVPLTAQDLSNAFERVTGKRPNDETAIMLERLPGLGRIDSDSPDRKFVDTYILDGLRAENIIRDVNTANRNVFQEAWRNELRFTGVTILSQYIKINNKMKEFNSFAIQCSRGGINRYLVSDIVAAILLMNDDSNLDFNQVELRDTSIDKLIFRDKRISNLQMNNCFITELDITNCQFNENCKISDCIIEQVVGVSDSKGLPAQIRQNEITSFQSVNTNAKVRALKLKPGQEILVTILRKVFTNITKGNGRKEEALLRGLAEKDKKLRDKILNKLLTEGILSRHKGDDGYIYTPNRKESSSVKQLLDELTLSEDPLWEYVTSL